MALPRSDEPRLGFVAKIVSVFLQGPLPVMIVVLALLAGVVALALTPREEEPQIVVPMADVLIRAPGLSARQVERQVATPLEKLLAQIDGVEHVYSMSRADGAVVTVRFYVGEDREDSLVKIYNKVHSNTDLVPPSVADWVVKPVEIDDVPIVVATLWSDDAERVGDADLRRLAEEVELRLQGVRDTNRVSVVGGRPRVVRVELQSEALAARRTTPMDVVFALGAHNVRQPAGRIERLNREMLVEVGAFVADADELRDLVVNVIDAVPVYLKDVASVVDGPDEVRNYTWIAFGAASATPEDARHHPAVSLAVAKKKGTNAVRVARDVKRALARLDEELFPPEVHVAITRDYGETADEKVDDLVKSLGVAVLTVVVFIGLILGWRAALVIALAVPVCYGLTLTVNLLAGYTINRVTLFALILALGLLVDDPITDVDNIERYFRMGRWKPKRAVLLAIQEVLPAVLMSTLAVIVSFTPLLFITGMMGPYMQPMALNVPLTVTMSTVVAICVTPFVARLALKKKPPTLDGEEGTDTPDDDVRAGRLYRVYGTLLRPMLRRRSRAWAFLGVVAALFAVAVALPAFRWVPLKMLPFDNKDEFQVVVNMPEGTTLETTEAAARALAERLRAEPEVLWVTGWTGLASPMDFNAMVRHDYQRLGANVADLRVGLLHKSRRRQQSHAIVLRLRRELEAVAERHGAAIKVVEVPPGPPVVATVTAEIYGETHTPYSTLQDAAHIVAERLRVEPMVVDVDTSVEDDQIQWVFETDREKAALSGVGSDLVAQTLGLAAGGLTATMLNIETEAHPLPVVVSLPRAVRSDRATLGAIHVRGRPGIAKVREGASVRNAPQPLVPLAELGRWRRRTADKTIYHKNLRRVAYAFAEAAGRVPAEVVLDVGADLGGEGAIARPLAQRSYLAPGGGVGWRLPTGVHAVWNGEGEWQITLRVFRDMGLAFAAALVGIFLILLIQTGSMLLAAIMMLAIPLTLIGIMPGFWALNLVGEHTVGGFPNPTMFTATAMIGMIALAGIVVRNSVILIDFIQGALREGRDLEEALIRSGAIRMRPILLTAGTTLLGNIVITLDPIFSGLAWAIIFGITASTLFTLGIIPVVYHLLYARQPGHGRRGAERVTEP